MSSPLLQATGLTQRFGDTLAVDAVSLSIQRGEILGLLGLNGAGKSSTLRMLAGVLAPTSGSIIVDGQSMIDQPLAAKQCIGFLPEVAPLYPDMRVKAYLKFAARIRRVPSREVSRVVDRLLATLQLTPKANKTIGNLSKGFKQRIGLAQALVHNPALLILDEPSSGLDPEQMRQMRDLIKETGNHCGIVFSSHLLSEVTDVCNRVSVLHHGRLVYNGELNNGRTSNNETNQYRVRFDTLVSKASLTNLPGITAAHQQSSTEWLVDTVDTDSQRHLRTLVEALLPVTEFLAERPSLEKLFSSLVTQTPEVVLG